MDLKQRSLMANVVFVYLLVTCDTDTVFYVGTTRCVGRRLNEHRNYLLRSHRTPLYVYMRDHDLELFRNVYVKLVAYARSREEAAQIETAYIERYKDTVTNVIKHDSRKYSTDPRYIKVRCVDTGQIWHAVKPAARAFGISRYKLTKAIERGELIDGHKLEFIKCRD